MARRPKPQLRLTQRLQELHEQEREDSHQFSFLASVYLLPTVVAVGIAAVVSVLTWLKDSLAGRAYFVAAALIIAAVAALIAWRRVQSSRVTRPE